MILIDSVYIHQSGGKILLKYFLKNLELSGIEYDLILDKRIEKNFVNDLLFSKKIFILSPSELQRRKFYKTTKLNYTSIFCFSNVPPPILISNIQVYIYFHNVLLLSNTIENNGYSIFSNIKFILKKYYIILNNSHKYIWFTQTEYIKTLLSKKLLLPANRIIVSPFYDINNVKNIKKDKYSYTFIYVADGVKQKNHIRLLTAFYKLNLKRTDVSLALTVPIKFKEIHKKIKVLKSKGLKIDNYENLNFKQLADLYSCSEYLIFPSLKESFGLPLLEAASFGCKVIASNLPYVKAIIQPTDYFDPLNSESIYECMLRNLLNPNNKQTNIKITNQISDLIQILIKNEKFT